MEAYVFEIDPCSSSTFFYQTDYMGRIFHEKMFRVEKVIGLSRVHNEKNFIFDGTICPLTCTHFALSLPPDQKGSQAKTLQAEADSKGMQASG